MELTFVRDMGHTWCAFRMQIEKKNKVGIDQQEFL